MFTGNLDPLHTAMACLALVASLAAGCGGEEDTGDTPPTTPDAQTMTEWLVDKGHFSYVHGTYGKPTYCGAFEVGAIAGFEDVRCVDNTAYVFTDNGDGTVTMEEAMYVHAISVPNPDGSIPWFVDHGYAGSLIWLMTPVDPALTAASPEDAMEYSMQLVEGNGPDSWFEELGSMGLQERMIFARGTNGALLDWMTAEYDPTAGTWTEYPKAFQDWAINVYPYGGGEPPEGVVGAFLSNACDAADRIQGATVTDGSSELPTGPGYCAPGCRMDTPNDNGDVLGLPVCEGTFVAEQPRAAGLQ